MTVTMFEPIAIVGMALRLPGQVRNGKDFWEMLVQKKNGLCKVPEDRYNIDGFYSEHSTPGTMQQPLGYFLDHVQIKQLDTSFFSFPKKELERLDPQQRQLLEVAWECMENAGSTNWRGSNIGCFVGVLGEDWRDLNSKETQQGGSYRVTGYEDAFLANRLSYEYNLHGPSLTVKTACSSSLTALHLACDAIRLGNCSSALVAGSSLIFSPSMTLAFSDQGIISPTGTCKTFDASADGYARGEAINMIYIKKLSDAIEAGDPIRAVIRATAANSDGRTPGVMNPSPEAQEALIRRAYDVAGIRDFSQTAFVECHGTGTQVGDPLETAAVAKVFGEKGVLITSVKPNVGHSEGAAGISSVIKAVLAIENRTIPPNILFKQPNPKILFKEASLRVPVDAETWPIDRSARVSVNSFGIGGANAHVIIDGWGEDGLAKTRSSEEITPIHDQYHLLAFSANSKESIEASIAKHITYMKENPVRLQDLSYTLAARREHLIYRTFAVTNNLSDLESAPVELAGPVPQLVYIFTGQGAQWPQMGRSLLQVNSVFRQTIRKLDQTIRTFATPLPWTIEDELSKPASESKIHTAELSQPLCTAIQIALVEALRAWKVEPDAVLGHSSGEIAAAYACDAITMEAAMAIACFRGLTAHQSTKIGGMAAISLGRMEVSKFLEPGVVIACENSQSSTTLSGDLEQVEKVVSKIKKECPDVLARMLKVEKAYHSHHMLDVGPAYENQLMGVVESATPGIPFYSSVTACRISGADGLGPSYWRKNLESPVLFNPALRVLRSELGEKIVFVEIGPHPALKGPVKQILREVGQAHDVHLSTLARGTDCRQSLLSLAGNLFLNNCMLDLSEVSPPGAVLTDLPSYSWVHDTKHWDESRLTSEWRFRTQPPHELLGTRLVEVGSEPLWRNKIAIDNLPWLVGHQVAGQVVFPAAGYIAMIGEALRQLSGSEVYSLRHVKISSALVLEHSGSVETVTTLSPLLAESPEDSPWYVFQVSSYNGTCWTKHCSGEARPSFDGSYYPIEPALPLPRKVTARSWYDTMKEVGFCYDGLFSGLNSISAGTIKNEAVAVATIQGISQHLPYKLHPAMIDQCFQLLCIAALGGQTRKCQRLSVPTYIEEIIVFSSATDLHVKATGSLSGRGAFNGDVLAQSDGKISLFMRGLNSSPLDAGELPGQGLQLVQQIEWKADSDFIPLENYFQLKRKSQKEYLLVESLFLLCVTEHLDQIKLTKDTPDYLRKLFGWMKMQVDSLISGKRNLVEKSQVLCDSPQRLVQIKFIAAEIQKTELADCAFAIMRLFEAAEDIFASRAQPLDVLMEGNLISRLYDILDSEDYSMAINALGYKNPRMSVLEIGAGTGGTSAKMLKALRSPFGERMYSKYTYTDISPGFMTAAKERFHMYENIEYKVLDISKDPSEQGFDLGAYDLIVGANVVHATPSLKTSLKHLRSLLRPGGHLFLQELSPEFKWVNYVWGYLPGWWLGADDERPDEPYVSPKRWSQELISAGFNSPHTIVYDAPLPFHINASIIVSGALESGKAQRATILCTSPDEPHVKAMKLQLAADDIAVDISLLGQDTPPGQDVICLLDMPNPILDGMSKETFDLIIHHLLSVKANIFWVTRAAQIDCDDPRGAMILGLARSARNEQAAKLYTIELDRKTPISTAASRIAAIQARVNQGSTEDINLDWEYAIVDGVINLPRMHWQTMAESMAQCAGETIRTTQHLGVGTPGLLHTMKWREEPLPELREDDVCVQIKSVGMNFKDVLIAMGILDNDVAEIGLEASGIVQSRGSAVKHLEIGDRVAFMCPGSFTTSRILPSALCVKLEPSISFEEGATIPCVYVTAMMALVDKGNLGKGQTVLIHSACGGVGLAAIQIAKSLGAEIFCTVGNSEKIKYLVENYEIPETHIFNSRDATFAADIMRATNDRGVDLVLNSLAGELLHASWKCVAEFGTMIEIGKRDFRRRARLAMDVFEANRTFIGLDLGLVHQQRPEQAVSLLRRCMTYMQSGITRPLPLAKVFEASAVQDAFRFMQGGHHIGKIVVNMPTDPQTLESVKAYPQTSLRSDRSYLLVGGLGGLGRVVASWMVENGARHLIFLSRSGDAHEETRDYLDELRSQGCQLQIFTGSVSKKADVETAVREASVPIAGVINMSMVLKDVSLSDMTFEDWTVATEPKVRGTQNLHNAITSKLDFFILFGSCSGIVGQWGQANYGAANTFLDAFVQYRHSQGLPASVIDLGAVGDTGFVSENHDILTYMQNSGTHLLQEQDVLDAVVLAIHRSHPSKQQSSISGSLDMSQIVLGLLTTRPITDSRTRVPWKTDPRMSFYHNLHSTVDTSINGSAEQQGLKEVLALAASTPEISTENSTREMIAAALGSALFSFLLKSEEDMRLDRSLDSIGVDSLVAMELRNWIRQKLSVEIGIFNIIHSASLLALADVVAQALLERYQAAV